jgi:opine dehydrogenase
VDSKAKVAVIGAGAGGLALAADAAFRGAEVTLFNRTSERLDPLRSAGGIRVRGALEGTAPVAKYTAELREVLDASPLVLVAIPAFAHHDLAVAAASYLRPDHIVVLFPGRTGGALEFRSALDRGGASRDATVAEAQTLVHTCRVEEGHGVVEVHAVKDAVQVAALPASRTARVMESLESLIPTAIAAQSVLHTSFGNVGGMLHPIPTLLNAGWVEALRTRFLYYYEGITPSVARVVEALDEERLRIARAWGVDVPSVLDWLSTTYHVRGDTLFDAIQANPAYRTIEAPTTLHHRYLFEDIPTGLVPLVELGRMAGVACPLADSVINLGRKVCGMDFRVRGRTPARMGIDGLNPREVHDGVMA